MERWVRVNGYEDYSISDKGNVKSHKNGKEIDLRKRVNAFGYFRVALLKNGKTKEHMIHRLVLQNFSSNPHEKETVNHIDGNKQNNELDNLEWNTRSEQMYHAYKLNLKQPQKGVKAGLALFTEDQVREVRTRYKPHCRTNGIKPLAKEYGTSFSAMDKCVRGDTYKDVK